MVCKFSSFSCWPEVDFKLTPHTEVLTQVLLYLPPESLVELSRVARRFHYLVMDPHAWRLGFAKFFPGHHSIYGSRRREQDQHSMRREVKAERRQFTRLTLSGTWMREYMIRTQLLRSLARGKPLLSDKQRKMTPSTSSPRSRRAAQAAGDLADGGSSLAMYHTHLRGSVTHMDASFARPSHIGRPGLIHASTDLGLSVTLSNPDGWTGGRKELFTSTAASFAARFPLAQPYGLGAGEIVGGPAVMDVSQLYGFIHSENVPFGGSTVFGSVGPRANVLDISDRSEPRSSTLPMITQDMANQTAVWIAKTRAIPALTNGLVGMMTGSSVGILTAYCCSHDKVTSPYVSPGQKTARWALCPGIPIISIKVDDQHDHKRRNDRRIWAVVLNALGEVFYLIDVPKLSDNFFSSAESSWNTGRSAKWNLIEPSRRSANPHYVDKAGRDWRKFPMSSSLEMQASRETLVREADEINSFLSIQPRHFRNVCTGWDMRRMLEVDFAGGDEYGAIEGIIVIGPGYDESGGSYVLRYTHFRNSSIDDKAFSEDSASSTASSRRSSVDFSLGHSELPKSSFTGDTSDQNPFGIANLEQSDQWRITKLTFPQMKTVQITAVALDNSAMSLKTIHEDILLNSDTPSPFSSTASLISDTDRLKQSSEVPGGRARFFAVGTNIGTVAIWNIRSKLSGAANTIQWLKPVRTISTESPEVTALALTSLYLVHGGNDGLIQAWDVLASTPGAIRTLHSKLAARARRLIHNIHQDSDRLRSLAARAICLHQDSKVLYGSASVGSHVKFWSFSAAAEEQIPGRKKRPRRRGSRRSSSGDDANLKTKAVRSMKKYFDGELHEMQRSKQEEATEQKRLQSLFGLGMFGSEHGAEDQSLAYAQLLSQEAYQAELEERLLSTPPSSAALESVPETPESGFHGSDFASSSAHVPLFSTLDDDVALAEALSASEAAQANLPPIPPPDGIQPDHEDEDIAEAIRLSLLEDGGRQPISSQMRSPSISFEEDDDFPPLSPAVGSQSGSRGTGGHTKGKRRG
jgi:hypothetical protein